MQNRLKYCDCNCEPHFADVNIFAETDVTGRTYLKEIMPFYKAPPSQATTTTSKDKAWSFKATIIADDVGDSSLPTTAAVAVAAPANDRITFLELTEADREQEITRKGDRRAEPSSSSSRPDGVHFEDDELVKPSKVVSNPSGA